MCVIQDFRRDVNAPPHNARLDTHGLPRRLRRGVGGGLVVALHLNVRLMERVHRGTAGALRGKLRVAAPRLASGFDGVGDNVHGNGKNVGKDGRIRRAVLSLFVKGPRHVRPRLEVVFLSNRVATLRGRKGKIICINAIVTWKDKISLSAIRITRIGVDLARRVNRRDEHATHGPNVLGGAHQRHVRRAREVRRPLPITVIRIVAIVSTNGLFRHFLMHRSIHANGELRFEDRSNFCLDANRTTRNDVDQVGTSILRLIRVARSTRLNGLNRSHSGSGLRVNIHVLRRNVRYRRHFAGVMLRLQVIGETRRQLIMFIGRCRSPSPHLFMDTASRDRRASKMTPISFHCTVYALPELGLTFRGVRRALFSIVFLYVRVRVRRQVNRPILLRFSSNGALRRLLFSRRMDLRDERRRALPGPPKATRGMEFPRFRRSMSRFHFVRVRMALYARFLGALCSGQGFAESREVCVRVRFVFESSLLYAGVRVIFHCSDVSGVRVSSSIDPFPMYGTGRTSRSGSLRCWFR